jgi:3-oxoacyl-[acyl-carrier protein] reductase
LPIHPRLPFGNSARKVFRMNIDLSDRIAVVTGGAGELGRVIVRTLAGCGADVAVHYLTSRERAEAVVSEVKAAGRQAIAVCGDVTVEAEVRRMHAEVVAGLGEADVIVNNAVIQYQPWQAVLDQPVADYESQFRSCVLHNVLMAKSFVPAMVKRGWGRVIGINTECAMQVFASQSAYAAGKRGMDGVLRVLAKEVGPNGVTVNQIAPGWMISEKYRSTGQERQPDYESKVPLRRRGTDQDVANAVAFLASDLAGFITGIYLPVAGGNVMPTI